MDNKEDLLLRIRETVESKKNYNLEDIYNFNWKNALRALPLVSAHNYLNKYPYSVSIVSKDNGWLNSLYKMFNRLDWVIYAMYDYKLLANKIISFEKYNPINARYCFAKLNSENPVKSFRIDDDRCFYDIFRNTNMLDPQKKNEQ